ncbi:BACON domain-containing protein [Bacteroides finegoldii]|uniref:BACON domain-containing protein n=1 Tax=Bacteroides finegoldii TaxID=338188 RepID=UPI002666129F|nr:BACON domain-containing protein [Bacteroides finegoldii]
MKYFSKITLGLILCAGFVTSCKDDDETGVDGLTIDKEEITVGAEGGTEQVAVSSNGQWVVRTSQPWIAISPANGLGSAVCSLDIDSTLANVSRTAQIRFSMDGREPKLITVTQFGFGKQILIKEPEVEVLSSASLDKRQFKATISANVQFKIDRIDYSFAEEASMSEEKKAEVEAEREGWITEPKEADLKMDLDRGARPRTIKVNFKWAMNVVPYTRVAKIRLVSADPNDELVDNNNNKIDAVVLTVTQKAAMEITDDRKGDSLAIITINSKLQSMMSFDTSESMMNWDFVTLWETTDKEIKDGEVPEEAVGRVRAVSFAMIDLKDGETLPKEIRHLKYLESFTVQSNANRQIRTVYLGEDICRLEYLKNLSLFSFGMNAFPDNFAELGDKLESLDLTSNNFSSLSVVTDKVNKENFPKLKYLSLTGCRATETLLDLSQIDGSNKYNGKDVGLHCDISRGKPERNALLKLLVWDKLISLELSCNFLEGELPTDDEMKAALTAAGKSETYQEKDFFTDLSAEPSAYLDHISKDTCQWLLTDNNPVTFKKQAPVCGKDIPRVLPFARTLRFNLNFFTGAVPNWLLFHPYFAYWSPTALLFNQQEGGKNTAGSAVGFNNVEVVNYDYSYYYGAKDPGADKVVSGVAYPLYYRKFVLSDTTD